MVERLDLPLNRLSLRFIGVFKGVFMSLLIILQLLLKSTVLPSFVCYPHAASNVLNVSVSCLPLYWLSLEFVGVFRGIFMSLVVVLLILYE